MRKIWMGIFLIMSILFGAERMVIGEMFTSTTCPPCANADLILDQLAEEKEEYFTPICYHVWWPAPGNDPFYHYNEGENKARNSFYSNHYAPHMCIDGDTSYDATSYSRWENGIEERHGVESPVIIEMWCNYRGRGGGYNQQKRGGEIFIKIINETDTIVKGFLHIVVAEDHIKYSAPNGVQEHNHVMLDMIPTSFGELVEVDSVWEGQYTYTLGDTIPFPNDDFHLIDSNNIKIVGFLQDHNWRETAKEIYQGARVYLRDVIGYEAEISEDRMEDESGDGILQPGEKADVFVRINNKGNDLNNVEVMMSTKTEGIEVEKGAITIPEVKSGEEYINNDDPLVIKASDNYQGDPIILSFQLVSGSYSIGETEVTGVKEETVTEIFSKVSFTNNGFIVNISLPSPYPLRISLYDISGKKVNDLYKGSVSKLNKRYSLKDFPFGVYFLVIKIDRTVKCYKIMKFE